MLLPNMKIDGSYWSTEEAKLANARVRKHRAKLRAAQCQRLEVWIGSGVIEDVRDLAKRKNCPTWEIVQDALQAYVTGHTPIDEASSRG